MFAISATYVGPASTSSESFQILSTYIHPMLSNLMLTHTYMSFLIPLVIALFYFSTPQSRTRPVFFLNLAAIFLSFVLCILIEVFVIHALFQPLNPMPASVNIAIGFVGIWESILVDTILLVRLISVYPPSLIGWVRFSLLIAIPVLLKLTRAINIIIFTKVMVDIMGKPDSFAAMRAAFSESPCIKIEWATQMLDNTYASLAFLWRLRSQGSSGDDATRFGNATFSQRLRTLSYIALTNFVVPAIFSIVLFVCLYHGVDATGLNELMLINTILSTFGVAFATVWAGNHCRQEAQHTTGRSNSNSSTPKERNVVTSHIMPIFRRGTDPECATTTVDESVEMLGKERSELQA